MRKPRLIPTRTQFLRLATVFEGSLVLVAYAIGWMAGIDPLAHLRFDAETWLYGVGGTLPLYGGFALAYAFPSPGMAHIKRFLIDNLGPLLASCRWYHLLYLGVLAGASEELLFRGVLQPWLERDWGGIGGLVFSNMIFALAHWVTPLYGLLAGLTGAYLGLALDVGSERDLGVPFLIHSLYDFLAFIAVAETYRKSVRDDRRE